MRNLSRTLRFWGAVLVGGVVSGCAAAMLCQPGNSTVECCVKNHPLTALDSCTATCDGHPGCDICWVDPGVIPLWRDVYSGYCSLPF